MATVYDDEDDIMLPLFEEPSSPARPKLKRLKKASERLPKDHLPHPDLPLVIQTLPPDSLEQELDPLFPDSEGLIHELRKEKLDQVIEDEPSLLPDSVEEDSVVEDDSINPLFPDSGGLMEELRRERMEEIKVRDLNPTNGEGDSLDPDQDELNDGLDPLFPMPGEKKGSGGENIGEGGLDEQLRQGKSVKKCLIFGEEDESSGKGMKKMEDKFIDTEDGLNDGLDPLFPKPGEYKAWEGEEIGEGGLIEELRQEKSAKKCLNFDKDDESSEKETKKKKRKSREKTDFKPKEAVRDKRRSEKESRVQLDMIHAESQRLLRETSDASFKPLPVVHKPISSVLEKIRLRKLEILKRSSACASFQTSENNSSVGAGSQSVDASDSPNETKDNEDLDMDAGADLAVHVRSSECALEGEEGSDSHDNRKKGSEKQNPKPDISGSPSKDEDESGNAHPSNGEHTQLENDVADKEMDEVSASSTACTNPAAPSDDVLSSSSDDNDEEEEEDYSDKENIDPRSRDLSTTGKNNSRSAFLKDFVDDEAEEEDDSDHDMTRFPENEDIDEDESDENEELKDLIATGYKEGEVDQERRNELHLKWLQQQDMAETDNVLQKLKYSNLQKEDLMDEVEEENEDEDEDGDEGEGSGDGAMSDSGVGTGGLKNILRQNSEKVKQMMMFNDDRDVYVPSDEDENEDHMLRRRISKQPDTEITLLLENEESREVFGLIKKLNIAPPPKRRGNHAANLDMLNVGRNSNSFSKFFGRKASGSMTSSRKTVIGRSFIFGRDDSNSRSGLQSDQSSENYDQSDMDPKENNQKRKHISTNLSSSQLKLATVENSGSSSNSGSSLFDILRRSSISSDEQIEDKSQLTETQATHIYSAFKVGRGFSRVETRF